MIVFLTFRIHSIIIRSIMENTNEEIIIPKKSNKTPVQYTSTLPSVEKKYKPLIVAVICAVVLIVSLIVVVFVLVNKSSNDDNTEDNVSGADDTGEIIEAETVYTTPEGTEDPEAAYSEWLEEQKESAETDEEKFDAEIQIINNEIGNGEFEDALSRLDAISRDNLSTEQLFRLYNVYTRAFEGNGDTEQYDEYVELRTEQLNILQPNEE